MLPVASDARSKEAHMEKRLVTRYATISPEAADENERRIQEVFAELSETRPDNVSYLVLRLADDSFVHVSFHDHRDDDENPISSTTAFRHFQDGHEQRREGEVDQQAASLVGAYITKLE
jgi:predicted SnoaL-like aldol condensation-catalyzing enzyme